MMMNRKLQLLSLVMLSVLLLPMPLQVPSASAATLFEDGFESGDFSAWTGTYSKIGGLSVRDDDYSPLFSHHGGHYAFAATYYNASHPDVKSAYCYKSIVSSNLYARGYFMMQYGFSTVGDGTLPEGARIFFIAFRKGSNNLAYAGWRVYNGLPRWCLTLGNGASYVDVYGSVPKWSDTYQNTEAWYCVELHWKKGASGGAELWVDGVKVCSRWGVNTATFGDISTVRVGQAEVDKNIYWTDLRFDCMKLSTTYVGPEPKELSDGFESGSFYKWAGRVMTSGESSTISSLRIHHGEYSGCFKTNGGGGYERAYIYKSVSMRTLFARGYFYVSKSGISDIGDRLYFIIFRSGSTNVAFAGWKKDVDGVTRWCLTVLNPLGKYTDLYCLDPTDANLPKPPTPILGRWYCVEVYWSGDTQPGAGNGGAALYIDGVYTASNSYTTTIDYLNPVSSVRFGLAETNGVTSSTVYVDCCIIQKWMNGPE